VDDLKIAAGIKAWCDIFRPRMVCFDKYATQSIADKLTNAGVICEDVSGAAFYQASGELLDVLVNHRLVHNGQREFITQMENCAAKQNDSAWRIIKRKSSGDISAPIGLAMVVHQLLKPNQTPTVIF
jgi:phage terminase large subunit-like protein